MAPPAHRGWNIVIANRTKTVIQEAHGHPMRRRRRDHEIFRFIDHPPALLPDVAGSSLRIHRIRNGRFPAEGEGNSQSLFHADHLRRSSRPALAPALLHVEAPAPYLPGAEGVETEHAAGAGPDG